VETWVDGELVAGLYCVRIGRAVFGESMFTRAPDASKIALAALVAWARQAQVPMIDCQQNTRHLASLGAREIARRDFVQQVGRQAVLPAARWQFEPVYWDGLLPHTAQA
jgi:leucyl/phenylalanyl-tRNA--protein transferase